MESNVKPCSVLVIGGCGFLGQHIISCLERYADHVTEIRVFDRVEFKNRTETPITKKLSVYVGDIFDTITLYEACIGVECVIHLASIIDMKYVPDVKRSHLINVNGTRSVLEASRSAGVRRFIYCSSTAAVTGLIQVYNGTEDTTHRPVKHLNTAYGTSKYEAEQLVLKANCPDFQTVSLRPGILYGEGNDTFIASRVIRGIFSVKYLPDYYDMTGHEYVYVGNVAWAFVQTERALYESDGDKVAGEVFFIGDDTPRERTANYYSMLEPCFEEAGLKPAFPLRVFRMLFICVRLLLFSILWVRLNVFGSDKQFDVWLLYPLGNQYIFLTSWEKARRIIGYKPIFPFEVARQRTIEFIKSVSVKKNKKKSNES